SAAGTTGSRHAAATSIRAPGRPAPARDALPALRPPAATARYRRTVRHAGIAATGRSARGTRPGIRPDPDNASDRARPGTVVATGLRAWRAAARAHGS